MLYLFNGSVEEVADSYNNGLHSLVEKHAPLCTKIIVLRYSCPWYSKQVHEGNHPRRKLEHKWCCSKLIVDHQFKGISKQL